MTNEQMTNHCQHCGCIRKEHARKAPYRCPTGFQESYWEPWTSEAYRAAEEAGKIAAGITGEPQEPAAPVIVEMPRRETPRTIDCTPNFGLLFNQFARDTETQGGMLAATICAAQFDVYPETAEALERRVGVLRAVQGFVAPATIALQAATTVENIEKLRDVMAGVLAKLNTQANEFEQMANDLAPQEEN